MTVEVSRSNFQISWKQLGKMVIPSFWLCHLHVVSAVWSWNPFHISSIDLITLFSAHLSILHSRSWTPRAKMRNEFVLNSENPLGLACRAVQSSGQELNTLGNIEMSVPNHPQSKHASNHNMNFPLWVTDLPINHVKFLGEEQGSVQSKPILSALP